MEPLRSDLRPAEALTDAERDARIEQLLLAGLDEYFSGSYEQAINRWTRVLFLDRHHDRARAYIERARRAQAEVQRETEAVLHQGIQAFHEGDVVRARRLVADAINRGASRDDAQGMLERIERLGAGQTAPALRRRAPTSIPRRVEASTPSAALPPRHVRGWVAAALLAVAAVGVMAVGLLGVTLPDPATWLTFTERPAVQVSAVPTAPAQLVPVPTASERFLTRGRAHLAAGRLREALAEVDRIGLGDPRHDEANALRAAIQRELLAVAAAEYPAFSPPEARRAPRPPE